MLSRMVSSAVARVRMIVHCAGAPPLGQAGATSGVVVAPSSTIAASATAGSRPHSATAPAVANKERFMFRFNTTPRRQLRQRLQSPCRDRLARRGPAPKRPAPRPLDLRHVYCLRSLRTGLLL